MKAKKTSVEISAKHHAALLALAEKRAEKHISAALAEAIEEYLRGRKLQEGNLKELLSLAGCLSGEEADALRDITTAIRKGW